MNPVNIVSKVLNDEFNLFAFLPAVNHFYYYIEQENFTNDNLIVASAAIFVSALLYNYLSETSKGVSEESTDNTNSQISVLIFVIIIIFWFPLLICSLANLHSMFSSGTIWPEVLVAGSVLFLSLLFSDLVLSKLLPSRDTN